MSKSVKPSGWLEEGPKFAHVVKERAPGGERRWIVRIYVRGEWTTNVIFFRRLPAKLFAMLLDISWGHGTTQEGSKARR